MSDETRKKWYPSGKDTGSELGTKALEGTGAGAAIGGAVGGTLGALAAVGTNLPHPGPWPGRRRSARGRAGRGRGGRPDRRRHRRAGRLGHPEDRAKTYEDGLQQGGAVMGVSTRSDEDADYLRNQWKGPGEHVHR